MEIWKDVPKYECLYQVSNLGNVKSFQLGKERVLKGSLSNDGYRQFTLQNKSENKYNVYGAHQLVAIAFLGHVPNGTGNKALIVDHKDNDIKNNHLDNLQLITIRHNSSKDKKDRTSDYIGVYYDKNRWRSAIGHLHNVIHLGSFSNEPDAYAIYLKAKDNLHLFNGSNERFRNLLNSM